MQVHRKVTGSIKFAGAYLYTWPGGEERGNVSALPENTIQYPRPGP